ncbi:MAG: hypothetical protein ABIP94_10155 [Planctomycetota bacterium]
MIRLPLLSLSIAGAGMLLASAARAQNLLSYLPAGAGSILIEVPCQSAVFPGPGLTLPPMAGPARALAAIPNGDVAVDNTRDLIYATNGVTNISRTFYQRLGGVAPAPLPNLPIPAFPAGGNVITGMAVDPATQHLFLTNGFWILETDPLAGMAVLAFQPAAAWLASLSGLEFDPALPGVIHAVTIAADVCTYSRAGGLLAVAPPPYAPPGAMATGLARDHSIAVGGFFYVLHGNGMLFNHTTGALHAAGLPAMLVGLDYIASATELFNGSACGGTQPQLRLSTLAVEGKAGFGLDLEAIVAGTPWAMVVIGFTPLLPPAPIFGNAWVAPPFVPFFAVLGGATSMHVFVPLPAGVAGTLLYAQGLAPCAAGGPVASEGLQIAVSR